MERIVENCILGFYDDLQAYYKEWSKNVNDGDYVVFLNEKDKQLMRILASLDENKNLYDATIFPENYVLGDEILSLLPNLVSKYEQTRRFPRILIISNVLGYDTECNALLDDIERGLANYSRKDFGSVLSAFLRTMELKSFVRVDKPFLLKSEYQSNSKFFKTIDVSKFREFEYRYTTLLTCLGLINPNFTINARLKLNKDCLATLEVPGFNKLENTYDSFHTYIFYKVVTDAQGRNLVYAIQLFGLDTSNEVFAIPFIMTPELTDTTVNKLAKHFSFFDDSLPAKINLRNLNLLWNATFLREFMSLINIEETKVVDYGSSNKVIQEFINNIIAGRIHFANASTVFNSLDKEDVLQAWQFGQNTGEMDANIGLVENKIYKNAIDTHSENERKRHVCDRRVLVKELETLEGYQAFSEFLKNFDSVLALVALVILSGRKCLQLDVKTTRMGNTNYSGLAVRANEDSLVIEPKRLEVFVPTLIFIFEKSRILIRQFKNLLEDGMNLAGENERVREEIRYFIEMLEKSSISIEEFNFKTIFYKF